ncbi:MAG: hypothetical protein OEW19_03865 [Acidobacteriota bacterium]|nr:hypothetical protein [Acidobacteriota bacterium]
MFVGHLAFALGARSIEPRVPLPAAVAAACGLDLLWPVLLLLGLETVRVHPGDTAFTSLAFDAYPWSHSLTLVVAWSVLAWLVTRRWLGSPRGAAIVGLLVFSHWPLDLVVHRPDLPLWPGGPLSGLGLWNSVPWTIVVEGGLLAAGVWMYAHTTTPRDGVGRWALTGLVAFGATLWITQPWAPPPPSATAVALGTFVLWLFVPWSLWIESHRTPGV